MEGDHYLELRTDRPGERLWVHQASEAPGVAFMKVQNSDRRWEVVHDTFAVCLLQGPAPIRAKWQYRRRSLSLGAGEIQVMEPGEVHKTTDVSGRASFFVMQLEPALLNETARELGAHHGARFRGCQFDDPALRAQIERLDSSLQSPASRLELDCQLAQTMRRLLLGCAESAPGTRAEGPLHPGVRRARRRLDQSFSEDLSLEALAKEAGMAKFYFAHCFADAYGVSPSRYLVMRRVEVARRLLQCGRSIAEASAMTGFADQSHLTRTFRSFLGYTPGTWARAMRRRVLHSPPHSNRKR